MPRRRAHSWVTQRRAIAPFAVCLALLAAFPGCKKKTVPHSAEERETATSNAEKRDAEAHPRPTPILQRIMAAWYRVPEKSLAKKRAPNELTAAHNTLPIGTRVRVRNPENGRTVVVRITDRGIHDRRVKLDLCKEAADELGVVAKGFSHLTMQVLRDDDSERGESEEIGAGS
ncbi:MAG: septal ring lytic transglycosylase RlpA family protein [Verrucomicrobiota bacterium]|nr:septal ring lytic transglycosylase RlpA family protein [Verrucomicrobiota bacterium]